MKPLTVAQQAFGLKGRFPEATLQLWPSRLVWVGELQPSVASRVYAVQVTFSQRKYPEVRVLKPHLEGREPQTPLPHVFDDGSLCLHLKADWGPHMLIVDTIVPWASEWLIYYEIWKFTDTWYGGGAWPPARPADAAA